MKLMHEVSKIKYFTFFLTWQDGAGVSFEFENLTDVQKYKEVFETRLTLLISGIKLSPIYPRSW